MSDFHCEFAINAERTLWCFQEKVQLFLLEKIRTDLTEGDGNIQLIQKMASNDFQAGIRYENIANNIKTQITVLLVRKDDTAYARVEARPTDTVLIRKTEKPSIVNDLIDTFGQAADGPFEISENPITLSQKMLPSIEQILLGQSMCQLPVIYGTKLFFEQYSIRPEVLSKATSGMAHVVVEPDKFYLKKFRKKYSDKTFPSSKACVYWPLGGYDDTLTELDALCEASDPKAAIMNLLITTQFSQPPSAPNSLSSLIPCEWPILVQELQDNHVAVGAPNALKAPNANKAKKLASKDKPSTGRPVNESVKKMFVTLSAMT